MNDIPQAEGFPGQRLVVLPRPLVQSALQHALTRQLLITDCGYFPLARQHAMDRPTAIDQAVLLFCAAGQGICRVGDEVHSVRAGQVVILPPGISHSYRADPADPWTLWWVHVSGESLHDFLESALVTPEDPVREVSGFSRAVDLIEESIVLLENDHSATGLLGASGVAWHLLSLLSLPANRVDRNAEIVREVQRFMKEHLRTPLHVADLAAIAKMSPSHFATVFRAQTGTSVMQYVTQVRMAKARELLDSTNMTIGEVARSCGFEDALYFSRRFSAFHGMNPSSYRAHEKG